jgi:predicted DNA-binding transcriptional regulator AlpA
MDGLMNQVDMMEFLRISRSTLYRMMRRDDFPRPVNVSCMKRWRRDDIEFWLRSRQDTVSTVIPVCREDSGSKISGEIRIARINRE